MMYCPHCCRPMPEIASSRAPRLCPSCARAQATADQRTSSTEEGETGSWVNAARVSNLAEAGYLVSLLEEEGIEARLVESPSFDAMGGAWRNSYLLQVEPEQLDLARPLLHNEAAEADSEGPYWNGDGSEEPDAMVVWRPVALMALAGVATLWYGATHWAEQRPPRPEQNVADLARAIDDIGQPFVVVDGEGNLVHRLSYQARTQCWLLESDHNGDGVVDRTRTYDARARKQRGQQEMAAWRN